MMGTASFRRSRLRRERWFVVMIVCVEKKIECCWSLAQYVA